METITLTITAATLQAIGMSLRELPFKIAQPAISEIEQQVNSYLASKAMEKKDGHPGRISDSMVSGGSPGDNCVVDSNAVE